MTGPIVFSHPTARAQLTMEGEVVTFRTSERTTGSTWWRDHRTGPKRGDVVVKELAIVNPWDREVLEAFVDRSGFDNVSSWQDAIAELNGELPSEGVLYRVTLDEEDRE